jgi:hypothetical protein
MSTTAIASTGASLTPRGELNSSYVVDHITAPRHLRDRPGRLPPSAVSDRSKGPVFPPNQEQVLAGFWLTRPPLRTKPAARRRTTPLLLSRTGRTLDSSEPGGSRFSSAPDAAATRPSHSEESLLRADHRPGLRGRAPVAHAHRQLRQPWTAQRPQGAADGVSPGEPPANTIERSAFGESQVRTEK